MPQRVTAQATTTSNEETVRRSRRPKSTAFRQQRLPAWQPVMTAGTVLPVFFIVGVIFVPIGIILILSSNEVQEKIIEYTECESSDGSKCSDYVQDSDNFGTNCSCIVEFELAEKYTGPVYMLYGLTNFYQNHRRYVKSRDDNQLLGDDVSASLASDCSPYKVYTDNVNATTQNIAPCGAIANSLFNDSLAVKWYNDSEWVDVPLKKTGIAWSTDKKVKFNNPSGSTLEEAFNGTAHPINWNKNVWELDPSDEDNNGYENEDLIVWMRTAALPNFRKPYRIIDWAEYGDGLPAGNYELHVDYAFPVTDFGGTKLMILTTTSWIGGKNPFLGYAYVTVGIICLIIGVLFLILHLKFGNKLVPDPWSLSRPLLDTVSNQTSVASNQS